MTYFVWNEMDTYAFFLNDASLQIDVTHLLDVDFVKWLLIVVH